MAAGLRKAFRASLHAAPALLPKENAALRRCLEEWFQQLQIRPRVVAEFDDAALMKVLDVDGRGFAPIPTLVAEEAISRCRLQKVGSTQECREQFYAITAERRIVHPAAIVITQNTQARLFANRKRRCGLC